MSIRVEEAGVSGVERSRAKTTVTGANKVKAGINGKTVRLAGLPNLDLAREAGKSHASPAIDSLLRMMDLKSDSSKLELYLSEVVQSARDTANRVSKTRIDQLTNDKLAQLKVKQEKIAAAQAKLDEASRMQSSSKILSTLQKGLSWLLIGASLVVTAATAGLGSPIFIMAATLTIAVVVNQGVATATDKGIAAHVASLAGASDSVAMVCDIVVSIALVVATTALTAGAGSLAAATAAVKGLNISAVVQVAQEAGALTNASLDIAGAGISYDSGMAKGDSLDLNSVAKDMEANIQQMDAFLHHATDSMIESNERSNQLVTTLLKSYSDLSDAMTRVRFTG
jgi:hypothetical protein